MSCKKCCGLVVEDHGEWRCLNCGCRPFETRITVKCSNPDCFALPEVHDYCARCWHSRKRNPLTEAEKSKAYRERNRLKQQTRRAKLKEAARDVYTQGAITVGEKQGADYENGAPLSPQAFSRMAGSYGEGNTATM